MADFTLDTSGAVYFATPYAKAHGLKTFYRWPDLSPFEQGYVRRALEELQAILDQRRYSTWMRVAFHNIAPETLAAFRKDCAAFSARFNSQTAEKHGAAFWRERNRNLGVAGNRGRPAFPPLTPFLDDKGKVRLKVAA